MVTTAEALDQALQHHQAGDLSQAEQLYHLILDVEPAHEGALHFLGLLLHHRGQHDQALFYIGQSLEINPNEPTFHSNLGLVYQALGEWDQAADCYRQALRLRPDFPEAHNNLGSILARRGRRNEAIECYRQALRLRPDYLDPLNNLGIALREQGRLEEAIASHRQALLLRPDYPEAQNNLGIALRDQGRLDAAVASFRQALRLWPDYAEAHINLGVALRDQGRLDEAVACFHQALGLRFDNPEAHNNLGVTLRDQGRLDEAVGRFRQALALRPDYAEAHDNLGNVFREQGKMHEAVASFQQALALKPDLVDAHHNLGKAFLEQGRLEEAEASFQQALHLKPDLAESHYNLGLLLEAQGKLAEAEGPYRESLRLRPNPLVRLDLATLLPTIYQSREEVLAWRRRFADNIEQLHREHFTLDLTIQTAPTPFLLAYQGFDDRDLLGKLTRLYIPPPDPPRPARPVRKAGKIKVGFVSNYFRNHTIGRLMRGLISQLSRDAFAVTVLSVGSYQDDYARFIQQHADAFLEAPANLPAARRLIAEQDLDVLIYTDIGMDPTTYSLAFSRLAPVQCAAWGHGVTTGIPTVDYFLSGELLETEEGDQHYTERLVRLPNLGIYYYRPKLPTLSKGRGHFGLPEERHLYACLQTLFKFHPDFDALLGGILRRDPRGLLVLIQGRFANWDELLRRRFAVTLPDVLERIRFVPPQANEDFLNLMALADVLLDPLYNVGGNSSFEGLALAKPIVTLPTRHLGGRLTWALYAQMGIWDFVANSAEEYVDKAVRLGTDAAYREAVQAKIREANDVLFENPAGVRGLEQFLQQAVAQAARS